MTEFRAVRRRWIPISVWLLAAVALSQPRTWRASSSVSSSPRSCALLPHHPLAVLLTAFWLLCLSGMRGSVRFGILAAAVALYFGTVRGFESQGDMVPRPVWRWQKTASEAVAADRATREKATGQPIGEPTAEDYPEFRNIKRDGVVAGLALATDWVANPPRQRWRQPAGEGYAGFVVVGTAAVTLEQRGPNEAVVCYDADTGHERWDYQYPAEFRESTGGDGPRATPTIAGGDVYSLGATGILVRLDGVTGKPKWRVEVLAVGNLNVEWGMAGSPLVVDQLVVVNCGRQAEAFDGKAVAAYDRDTGKPVWQAGSRKAGYAAPMVATLCGVRQVLTFDAAAVAGFDLTTGKELWNFAWEHTGDPGINVGQPLVLDGDRVFISAGYGKGAAMVQLKKSGDVIEATQLWTSSAMKCKFTSPVFRGGFIYGIDDGVLACIDATTGKRKWKDGRYGHGQLLLSGDLIIVGSETGKLALVEASPADFKEVASLQVLEGSKNWNHLALARGRAYVRNHKEMACYDLPKKG
ncbi:MAG: PQQ-binding-like beta-propeller repeat protein [Gemmataceae bacterium]